MRKSVASLNHITYCCAINLMMIIVIDHPRYIEVNTGCRHFDVHGGPENIPVSRITFNAKVCHTYLCMISQVTSFIMIDFT